MILKKSLCAVLATALLLSVAACAPSNPETVVATVNGENIHRWEVDYLYDKSVDYFEDMRGVDLSLNSNYEIKQTFREQLLLQLVEDTAFVQDAKAKGYDLTPEEKAAVDAEYDDMVARNVKSFMENDFAGDPDAEQKAIEKWNQSLKDHYLTEEFLRNNMYNNKVHEKLAAHLSEDLVAEEAQLKQAYDTTIQNEKQKYAENPDQYAIDAANPNNRVIYTPEGWVRVKLATIAMPEAIQKQIDDINAEISSLVSDMGTMAQEKGQEDSGVQAIFSKVSALDDQVISLQAEGKKQVEEQAAAMKADFEAGMGFAELFEKYNTDPAMEQYPYKDFGVLLSEGSDYDGNVKAAALGLEEPGDMSGIIEMANGYTLIQLVEKVQAGAKPLSDPDVTEFLTTLLLANQRQGLITEYSKNLLDGMDIKIYNDKL